MCFLFLRLFMESCICMTKGIIFYYIKLFTSNTTNAFQFLLLFCLTRTSSVTTLWSGGQAKAFIYGFLSSLLCHAVEVITVRAPPCAEPGAPLWLLRLLLSIYQFISSSIYQSIYQPGESVFFFLEH